MFILPKNLAAPSNLPATCFFGYFLKPHWSVGGRGEGEQAVNKRGMRRSNSKVFELMRGPEHRSFKLWDRDSQLQWRPFFWTSSPKGTHVQNQKYTQAKLVPCQAASADCNQTAKQKDNSMASAAGWRRSCLCKEHERACASFQALKAALWIIPGAKNHTDMFWLRLWQKWSSDFHHFMSQTVTRINAKRLPHIRERARGNDLIDKSKVFFPLIKSYAPLHFTIRETNTSILTPDASDRGLKWPKAIVCCFGAAVMS